MQDSKPKIKSFRCCVCNKKIGLIPFTCRCDNNKKFCSIHRLDHNCNYDYHKDQIKKIRKENPIIIKDKIQIF